MARADGRIVDPCVALSAPDPFSLREKNGMRGISIDIPV
jgi:hypothetical protein